MSAVFCRYLSNCSSLTSVQYIDDKGAVQLKPNSITLASSELAPNMFGASSELAPNMLGASSELASVMEFGFY